MIQNPLESGDTTFNILRLKLYVFFGSQFRKMTIPTISRNEDKDETNFMKLFEIMKTSLSINKVFNNKFNTSLK